MDQEVWRIVNVITYEGEKLVFSGYEVSNTNKIRSLGKWINNKHSTKTYRSGRILKPDTIRGYKRVALYEDNKRRLFSVHRIVASTFPEICGEWFEGAQVNHKDCNPSNNVPENLEWCTAQYNSSYLHHMKDNNLNRADLSKPIIQLTLNGDFVKRYPSIMEAERTGIASKQNIMRVLKNRNGRMFQAGGYRWVYESGW